MRAPAAASRLVVAPPRWPQGARFNLLLLVAISLVLFRQVLLHPTEMLWGNDLIRLHSTLKAAQYSAMNDYGRFPLWDGAAFGGRSIVGDPVAAALNPLAWLFWISNSPVMFGYYFWVYVTAGAIGAWLWMRRLGADSAGALIAAIAFAFSGKTVGHLFAGHLEFLPGVLCLPWLLWAAERLVQRRTIGSAVALGAVLCLTATMGSVQSLYWDVLLLSLYVPGRAWHAGGPSGAKRPVALLALAGVVFLVGGMAWWLPIVRQTLLLSARAGQEGGGFEFATMASAAPSDLLRVIWPFASIPTPRPFASDPENAFFWESASYPGLVAVSLAIVFVVIAPRDKRATYLGLGALVTLALALGASTPLYRLAYEVVPGWSMFRAPGRLLFFFNLFLAAMAGFGMAELLRARANRRWVFVGVTAVLLAVGVAGNALDNPSSTSRLVSGAGLSMLVLLLLAIAAVLLSTSKFSSRTAAAAIVGVAVLDLGVVWDAHLVMANPEQSFDSNSVVDFLVERQREHPGRVFDPTETVPQHLAVRHGLELITGYHPGLYRHQLELYQALWPPGEGSSLFQVLMHSPNDIACTPLLDLMNTRYVVAYEPQLDDRFERIFSTPAGEFTAPRHVYERKNALPRAFAVPHSMPMPNGADATQAVCQLEPRETCFLEGEPIEGGTPFQPIEPTSLTPGELQLDFVTQAPGVLVISESWHPDWTATDGGQSIAVQRANLGFLGIPVATGTHSVRVWYQPWDFYLGCVVSAAFWLIVLTTTAIRRLGARRSRGLFRFAGLRSAPTPELGFVDRSIQDGLVVSHLQASEASLPHRELDGLAS